MLKLKGITIKEGEVEDEDDFLVEIMEKDEEVTEARRGDELDKIAATNQKDMSDIIDKTAAALDANDLDLAKKLLIRLKYYTTLEDRIKEKLLANV